MEQKQTDRKIDKAIRILQKKIEQEKEKAKTILFF